MERRRLFLPLTRRTWRSVSAGGRRSGPRRRQGAREAGPPAPCLRRRPRPASPSASTPPASPATSNPDWARARATRSPSSFAIIRAVLSAPRPDPVFPRDWPKLKAAGLVRGAYPVPALPRRGWQARRPRPRSPRRRRAIDDRSATLGAGRPAAHRRLDEVPRRQGRPETGPDRPPVVPRRRPRRLRGRCGPTTASAPIVYTSARVWRDDLRQPPRRTGPRRQSPLWLARYPLEPEATARRDCGRGQRGRAPAPAGAAALGRRRATGGSTSTRATRSSFRGSRPATSTWTASTPALRGATRRRACRWVRRRLGIAESGRFDAATEGALRAFQRRPAGRSPPAASSARARSPSSAGRTRPVSRAGAGPAPPARPPAPGGARRGRRPPARCGARTPGPRLAAGSSRARRSAASRAAAVAAWAPARAGWSQAGSSAPGRLQAGQEPGDAGLQRRPGAPGRGDGGQQGPAPLVEGLGEAEEPGPGRLGGRVGW